MPDGDDLYRVNLGPSLASVSHVEAMFAAAGLETTMYRTGDGEGVGPSGATILLFRADDLEAAQAILDDVVEATPR